MKICYYNIDTGEFNVREAYRVNGKPGQLPHNVIELNVINTPRPQYNPKLQKLNTRWEKQLSDWVEVHTVINKTELELQQEDWKHHSFSKRIIAPIELANQYPQIKVWFDLKGFPIEVVDNLVHLYCNTIEPSHQQLVDSLDVITIEERPFGNEIIEDIESYE